MSGPNIFDLFSRGKFATSGGGFREVERTALIVGKNDRRLLITRKIEHHAGNIILQVGREAKSSLKCLFQKFCHG